MKFEFDSNNATELRAVRAAIEMLVSSTDHLEAAAQHVTAANRLIAGEAPELHPDNFKSPLVAAVTEAREKADKVVGDVSVVTLGEGRMGGVVNTQPQRESVRSPECASTLRDDGPELDSAGQPWNPELHSSSRAKVADGTWKKKRGAGKAVATVTGDGTGEALPPASQEDRVAPAIPVPPTPPAAPVTPPAPPVPVAPAAPAPTSAEGKIWALISGGVVTVNQALEVARAAGLADLGALRQSDEAKKLEVLRVLEGE